LPSILSALAAGIDLLFVSVSGRRLIPLTQVPLYVVSEAGRA
jgi:hypothetical protein